MNKWKKLLAASLCLTMCLGVAGTQAYAKNNEKEETKQQTEAVAENKSETKTEEKTETKTETTKKKEAKPTLTKEETVYVMADAEGKTNNIIVSDWINNPENLDTIKDVSNLSDIENVKGDETYSASGKDGVTWNSEGNDIYYQGNSKEKLPVELTVSYKLDGKTISAEDLVGKSGKVTIRFDYKNNQYEMMEVDGKQQKVYVPFVMMTGMLLDNEVFRNVTVTNGKIINDGDRTVAVGFGLPGMKETLALTNDKISVPDYFELTADVTDFEMGETVSIATNEVFNKIDEEKFDSLGDLKDSMSDLTDAMDQLVDGSSALYDGLSTLLEKSGELVDGVDQLATGSSALARGAQEVNTGVGRVESGAAQLSGGLDQLSGNSASLVAGATQVFNSLIATANSQITEKGLAIPALSISNYASVLNGAISSLDETAVYNQALAQVTAQVEANRSLIKEKVTAAVKEKVVESVTAEVQAQVTATVTEAAQAQVTEAVINAATGMSVEDYNNAVEAGLVDEATQTAVNQNIQAQLESESTKLSIENNVNTQMNSEPIKAIINSNVETMMGTGDIQNTIAQNVELEVQKAISENMASDAVQSQLTAASEGAKSLINLKASLDGYNAFYIGLQTYTSGVDAAAAGAASLYSGIGQLSAGTSELAAGAATLNDGVQTLKNKTPDLVDGVTQLKDGSKALSDGIKQFYEEGIQKLVDLIEDNLEGLVSKVKATMDVSKQYNNYSGIGDNMRGSVKFIYRTAEIKA